MTRWLAWLAAPALVLVSGCATANFTTKGDQAPSIVGSQIFIYSFLDVRQAQFGGDMIEQVNQQLTARLIERGVDSRVVTYRQTEQGRQTARAGSVWVPVQDIVEAHTEEEAAFGADYRIVVMPAEMTIYDVTQSYEVAWEVVDVRTNATVWSSSMRGQRTVWINNNEDAEGRARTIVDGVIAEMTASGLFASPTPSSPPTAT